MADLLSPLSFCGLNLRNRIVMPPMWSGQATAEGEVTDTIVEYHRSRAAAGCGLVIVEHSFVHPGGRHSSTQIGSYSDRLIPGLRHLAESVREQGAVVALQLSHAGPRAQSALLGRRPAGPSAIRHPYEPTGEIPQELSVGEIREIVHSFGLAAVRARDAGYSAVEVHAAHGFLLSCFLSPLTNTREDDYGGRLENRSRIHLEVIREIRRAAGEDFPVFVRLGASDETPGGLEPEEACAVAGRLAENGASLIDVSGGLQGSRPAGRGPGYFAGYSAMIKAQVSVPVIVTGGILEPEFADRLIREGKADLVGIGRAMLEDAAWAEKAIRTLQKNGPSPS